MGADKTLRAFGGDRGRGGSWSVFGVQAADGSQRQHEGVQKLSQLFHPKKK